MGLVGAGFVGPHHVDAVRRLGFVDIVAVAGSSDASGQEKARALGARRGYGSYRALIDDPDVQVVHNATPNHLHEDVAIRRRKHQFVLRLFDAAALLGLDAVCGFVGRNQRHSMDENLVDFEEQFVPLLKDAKARCELRRTG